MHDCTVVYLRDDGTPVVRLASGAQRPLRVYGVEVPQPPPDLYVEILTTRIGRVRLQCEPIPGDDQSGRYRYLAWHDKTGDVWRDLARLLIEQGAARVAADEFAERDEYLQAEAAARIERRGLWVNHLDSTDSG
jgi:endonuclease YncB( thermonuclease family)